MRISFTKTSSASLLWKTASVCCSETFTINCPYLCLLPQLKAWPCPRLSEDRRAICSTSKKAGM
jgi:hypothetical protein